MKRRFFSALFVAVVTLFLGTTTVQAALPVAGDIYGSYGIAFLNFEGYEINATDDNGSVASVEVPDVAVVSPIVIGIGKQITDRVAVEFRLGGIGGSTGSAEVTTYNAPPDDGPPTAVVTFPEDDERADANVPFPPIDYSDSHAYTVDLERFVGGYLRVGNFATESFYPYAVIGYTKLTATARVSTSKITESEESSSLGLGFIKEFSNGWGLGVEYMKYISSDEYFVGDVDGWTLHFGGSF